MVELSMRFLKHAILPEERLLINSKYIFFLPLKISSAPQLKFPASCSDGRSLGEDIGMVMAGPQDSGQLGFGSATGFSV